MPKATRLYDKNTGHDICPAIGLETGSPNVFINGLNAGRKTDTYKLHGCPAHPPHADKIIGGSSSVFINGLPAGRVGDTVVLSGTVMEGSYNVIIGG